MKIKTFYSEAVANHLPKRIFDERKCTSCFLWLFINKSSIVFASVRNIYFNLSFWYKLIDETRWGAYFSLTGCIILILMNIFLVPKYGYIACAWAGFTGYGVAMLLSYFVGQKKYPIQYDLKAIGMYVLLAAVLYVAAEYVSIDNIYLRMAYRTVLLLLFIAYVVKRDLPLNQIPILNKLLKH